MARKKKLTLEQEFEERKANHKCQIIMYALIKFSDTIYNSRYFKRYKNCYPKPVEGFEDQFNEIETRAYRVEGDIGYRTKKGEVGLYDRVYEFCWKKVNKVLEENMIA